jgi:hypothetical protein
VVSVGQLLVHLAGALFPHGIAEFTVILSFLKIKEKLQKSFDVFQLVKWLNVQEY